MAPSPVSNYTPQERARISSALSMQLGPEYVSRRAGPGNSSVFYLEGWKAIRLANEIFGCFGWHSEARWFQVDYIDTTNTGVSVGLSCTVRVTLKDGTFHEDIGYGSVENARSKAMAFDKCKKEAMTDGIKRALRQFGNALGNCLYDKDYLKEIQKVKKELEPMDTQKLFRTSTVVHENDPSIRTEDTAEHYEHQTRVEEKVQFKGVAPNPPQKQAQILQQQQQQPNRLTEESADEDSFMFSDDEEQFVDVSLQNKNNIIEVKQPSSNEIVTSTQNETSRDNNSNEGSTVPSEVTFVSASSADRVIKDPTLQTGLTYDASFQSKSNTNVNSSINYNKSVPIKRTDVNIPTNPNRILLSNTNLANKVVPNNRVRANNPMTPIINSNDSQQLQKRAIGLPLDKLPNKRLHK